jgi:hypothetical protein
LDDELNLRQHDKKSCDEGAWLGDWGFGFTHCDGSFEQGGNGHKGFFLGSWGNFSSGGQVAAFGCAPASECWRTVFGKAYVGRRGHDEC